MNLMYVYSAFVLCESDVCKLQQLMIANFGVSDMAAEMWIVRYTVHDPGPKLVEVEEINRDYISYLNIIEKKSRKICGTRVVTVWQIGT